MGQCLKTNFCKGCCLKMKTAILQNRIGVDGRSVVVAEMVRVCNEYDVRPCIFTFTQPGDDYPFKDRIWAGP